MTPSLPCDFGHIWRLLAGMFQPRSDLYAWEIEVSAAFLGSLRCFEIAFRNAVQDGLSARFGRWDWWRAPGGNLHFGGLATVQSAEDKLVCANQVVDAAGTIPSLPLGFWVSLFGRGNDYETRFWRPKLGSRPARF